MVVQALEKKKLIVVTGKGGSGKSLVSLALAHRLSKGGKRVWLVELGRKRDQAFTRLPGLVGEKTPSHQPKKITLPGTSETIELSVLDPTESLAEYVDLKLPTAGLAGLLLNNRVTASFLEVVPGLPDLVSIGKLWHALTRAKDGPEIVVLDAPATGHALPLLHAPRNFARITKVGPIYKDASFMTEFLENPGETALVLTTLPEEMSLQETEESEKLLKGFPRPYLIVNRLFPDLPRVETEKGSVPYQAYEYARKRGAREREALEGWEPSAELPFFFPDPDEPPLFARLSEALP